MATFGNGMPPLVDAHGAPFPAQGWQTPAQPVQYLNGTPYVNAAAPIPASPSQNMPWLPFPGNGPPQHPNAWAQLATPGMRALPQNALWMHRRHSSAEDDRVIPDDFSDVGSSFTSPSTTATSSPNRVSWHAVLPPPSHISSGMVYEPGPREVYSRPKHWRREFKMPNSPRSPLLDTMKSLILPASPCHPTISYKQPPICHWNLRLRHSHYALLNDRHRPHSPLELEEAATNPPVTIMRLRHSLLPWYIDINASSSPGDRRIITIGHLLSVIYHELHRQIDQSDFYNEDVSEQDRQQITESFRQRTYENPMEYGKGVRRIDFLGDNYIFVGIRKSRDEWVIKTIPARRS